MALITVAAVGRVVSVALVVGQVQGLAPASGGNVDEPTAAECLAYLHDHMPDSDKRSPNITDDFLRQNVDLALQARAATHWGKSVPKTIFCACTLRCVAVSTTAGTVPSPAVCPIRCR